VGITKQAVEQCTADALAIDACQSTSERQADRIAELEENNEELFNRAFDLRVTAAVSQRRALWRGVGWGLAGGCAVGLGADLGTGPTLRSSAALGGCVLTGLALGWLLKPREKSDEAE